MRKWGCPSRCLTRSRWKKQISSPTKKNLPQFKANPRTLTWVLSAKNKAKSSKKLMMISRANCKICLLTRSRRQVSSTRMCKNTIVTTSRIFPRSQWRRPTSSYTNRRSNFPSFKTSLSHWTVSKIPASQRWTKKRLTRSSRPSPLTASI